MTELNPWTAGDPVELGRIEEDVVVAGNPQFRTLWNEKWRGAYLPSLELALAGLRPKELVEGCRDDNRSAILPGRRATIGGTEYALSVKGCGAGAEAYQPRPVTGPLLREICHDPAYLPALADANGRPTPFVLGERWWGNAPYGAQAPDNALLALLASLRANGTEIAGLPICPVLAVVRLPGAVARVAREFYWYRRYDGEFWQELRLMPSNIRVFFHSPVTIGLDPGRVFSAFGIADAERAEAFLGRWLRSGVAALTLFARSLRRDPTDGSLLGLDFQDVYLDKDAVVAPDGALHFADLEGLEMVREPTEARARDRIAHQFHRNLYEVAYAAETIAAEAARRFGFLPSGRARRAWLIELLERALRSDPYVALERRRTGAFLVVRPPDEVAACATEFLWSTEAAG